MVWSLPDVYQSRAEMVAELPPVDVVLEVKPRFVADGPEVKSYAPDWPEHDHGMWWEEVSRVLGQPVPYWPSGLRLRGLLKGWRPGADAVEAPARPELDNGVLLRMAAMYEPDHPTSRVLVNLARIAQRRPTLSAAQDLDILNSMVKPETTVVAARPMDVPDADDDDVEEHVRRLGWLEILHRRDLLAEQCVEQVQIWDNGRDLPFGNVEQIHLSGLHAREWAARLESSPRTIAHRLLGDSAETAETFIDPLTDAPVARIGTRDDDVLIAASVQRLPATAALAEVVLDNPIWIRTADGTLYPAPQSAGYGLSWGYSGSGPGTLALLIDALLTDVTTAAPDDIGGPPTSLEGLFQMPFRAGTVLTRDQLEAARRGELPDLPDIPEDRGGDNP